VQSPKKIGYKELLRAKEKALTTTFLRWLHCPWQLNRTGSANPWKSYRKHPRTRKNIVYTY